MIPLTVGSLFSGIGGLDLGLERAGMKVVWNSEIEPYCCRVLKKHWPGVPNLGDVRTVDWSKVERPDLICGGYPCQPFSTASAGARLGTEDERHLWPFMRDAIGVLRPRYALMENVSGHLSLGFGAVLGDLAALGYDAEWDCIPAVAVGAPHRRDRVFIVAHADESRERVGAVDAEAPRSPQPVTDANGSGRNGWAGARSTAARRRQPEDSGWWAVEPNVGRVVARLSARMDGGRLDGSDSDGGTGEILRALRLTDAAQTVQWPSRGLGRVQAPEVLLAEVCEYEGPPKSLGHVSLESPPASRLVMRGVWFDGEAACPSCRRTAGEQRTREHPDTLHVLSRVLACDCGAAWLDPTGTPTSARVDRLRALGNAVVPQVAEWIGRQLLASLEFAA